MATKAATRKKKVRGAGVIGVDAVRAFNRFYTEELGLIGRGFGHAATR